MKICLPFIATLLTLSTIIANASTKIEAFTTSHSYSNILPIKQLVEDDWQQSPQQGASDAFTKNEVGIRAYIDNFSLSVSQRYDYFVKAEEQTAQAFYLNRNKLALNTAEQYNINLQLLNQRSNGIKVGYKFDYNQFSTELRLGYWRILATRESRLNGLLSGDGNDNISANAQLSEFYSTDNFLKRSNKGNWNTQGSGLTVDLHMRWQPSTNIDIKLNISDLYSKFTLKNAGYSAGKIDSEGTFINSIGGVAYVPLYRGIETSAKQQFSIPETINLNALYRTKDLAYVSQFSRQGEINFYYLGVQFEHQNSTTTLLFDIENAAPEIQFHHPWISAFFSIDDTDVDQAMLFKLGVNLHFTF